jgi:hypothetical protein
MVVVSVEWSLYISELENHEVWPKLFAREIKHHQNIALFLEKWAASKFFILTYQEQ